MHQGRILDIGTLNDLQTLHQQDKFEDVFFGLLSRVEVEDEKSWNQKISFDVNAPQSGAAAS